MLSAQGKTRRKAYGPNPINSFRTTATWPAVDFDGTFITVQEYSEGIEKGHLCLFTCVMSMAVHLEVAFGLDTNSFLDAFYRMISNGVYLSK
jgi:hypothetical protein